MTIKIEGNHSQAHLFEELPVEASSFRPLTLGRSTGELAQTIQEKGWAFLKVTGKSMFPWIREEDIVFLRRAKIKDIARGDVVVFEKSGTLCVHRVLSVEGNAAAEGGIDVALITKGDATADSDDPVSADEFRGKVEFVYRRNREIRIARGWRKYLGKFLAFVSPATPWWKPATSLLNRESTRCVPQGVPRFEAHRPSEHSAD
ncbi:MAG: signal peptidase I [Candidatus Acidiferrales bacterium]